MSPPIELTRKDFASDQEVRWCPGCGDYAILAALQRTLSEIGVAPHDVAVVSGIGCSSRLPYYMNTYGFHTIHGRAPAVATGLKLARPELDVWVVTGDGDGLSIGGNHLLHVLRRNVNLQVLLFNNQIYGLTKGQYSPTSAAGKVTPSTPFGSIDQPLTPARFALGAGARFVARAYDVSKELPYVLRRAHAHAGASFVEILQNCPVFNDGVFDAITSRRDGPKHQLWLEHGKPMVLGPKTSSCPSGATHGLRLGPGLTLECVRLGEGGVRESDLLVHDETNATLAYLLAGLTDVVAFGVLYQDPGRVYDEDFARQVDEAKAKLPAADIDALLRSGHTWVVP